MTNNLAELLPHLDPNNTKLRAKYEEDLGYAEYLKLCRFKFKENHTFPFHSAGKFKLLEQLTCDAIIEMINQKMKKLDEKEFRAGFLTRVFTEQISDAIKTYFQSNFMPLWMRFYRNDVDEKVLPPSLGWHVDAGPDKHLKVLVYLNSTEESGGNTALLDEVTSYALEQIGYAFCPLEVRMDNLSSLCSAYDLEYFPVTWDIQTGDAVLFDPGHIMHKAIWPTKGPRYMAQICLVPSPIDWQEACNKYDILTSSNKWPKMDVKK